MPEMADILEEAVKLEQDGKAYYRDAAEKADNPLATHTFNHLAEMEAKHERLLRAYCDAVKETGTCPAPEKMDTREYNLLEEAQDIFKRAQEEMEASAGATENLLELYEGAMEFERKSIDMYQKQADAADIEEQRELFAYLVNQEKKHLKLLENGQRFLDNPEAEWWVEAEQWIVTG